MNKAKFAEVQITKKSWPSPQDYNEAMQSPAINLAAPELKVGKPGLNNLGLPKAITGSFASVYYLECPKQDFAVRCFLHNIANQQERYEKISEYLNKIDLPIMADFDYLQKGILCHGKWLPILKMDWVVGQNLIEFIGRNLDNASVLEKLRLWLRQARSMLQEHGIAHGDLQHGNVLVGKDSIKLVDYDGMFVPALAGETSNELGHRNYQHPDRTKDNFGPYLDNFSAWLIDSCLYILQRDPRLWLTLRGGEDCLLLREKDLQDPYSSFAFHELEKHANSEIRERSKLLRWLLTLPVEQIPEVDSEMQVPQDFPALDSSKMKPDWLSSAQTLVAVEKLTKHVQYQREDQHVASPQQPVSKAPTSVQNKQDMEPYAMGPSSPMLLAIILIFVCIVIGVSTVVFDELGKHDLRTTTPQVTTPQTTGQHSAFYADKVFNQGISIYNKKEFPVAIKHFDQAIKLDPTQAIYYRNRGAAYGQLGEHYKAIEDFKEAVRLEPRYAGNYFNLGQDYYATGQYAKAAEMYQKTLDISPSHKGAQNNLRVSLEQLKKQSEKP
ncbi:MAG: tetratricopeptide repeat protein [Candidatus Obscuribacterales bacterium]|nr:tetratricopeptide repeat protein [Candidatus Obscuribacterales bacterium]